MGICIRRPSPRAIVPNRTLCAQPNGHFHNPRVISSLPSPSVHTLPRGNSSKGKPEKRKQTEPTLCVHPPQVAPRSRFVCGPPQHRLRQAKTILKREREQKRTMSPGKKERDTERKRKKRKPKTKKRKKNKCSRFIRRGAEFGVFFWCGTHSNAQTGARTRHESNQAGMTARSCRSWFDVRGNTRRSWSVMLRGSTRMVFPYNWTNVHLAETNNHLPLLSPLFRFFSEAIVFRELIGFRLLARLLFTGL